MLQRTPNGQWFLEGNVLRPGDRVQIYQLDDGWRTIVLTPSDLEPQRSLLAGLPGRAIRRP